MARKQLGATPSNAVDTVNKAYVDISPTAVKTGAYSANPNELIPADATTAGFTVTLPTSPADKTKVVVKKIDSTSNVVTITTGGLDVINNTSGATSSTLTLQYQTLWLQYSFASSIWYVVSNDLPLSQFSRTTRTTVSNAPGATPTWNNTTADIWQFTSVATAITSMTTNFTSTTPVTGQKLMVSFKDNGTAQSITWGASFQSSGVAALLTTTVINKMHWVSLMYDGSKWTCMASDPNGY